MTGGTLSDRIDESGIKYKIIAEKLGISIKTLYNKMNGVTDFSVTEARKLKEILSLSESDCMRFFFANRLH